MALTKRELEEINEELQVEIRRLRALDPAQLETENQRLREENESLTATLARANERLKLLEEHYNKLRDYVAAQTGA